jgi:hypothetical protein
MNSGYRPVYSFGNGLAARQFASFSDIGALFIPHLRQ